MNNSKIIKKAEDLFFKKYPGRKCKDKIKVIGEIVEIMETYFEAKRKMRSQKRKRQPLNKKNNHGFHNRQRLHLAKK